ncbi:cardiac-enriched FHL2-interacting protein isoform X2 [Antennarius striatus]|uniref:cardiac-enriched FHL2-interacting protein isoform X2 n=1 Tax=Antennarius striatus TaxID=241820 RepID=UPI0035AED106
MTSAEKRRSGRKNASRRKHSDGGYSDTSSGGSFLDETDREVSNLTDRAFRSLCIGDEAVYNDSDPCSSSPCTQRDRQQAFSQRRQDSDKEDRGREELKRAAHESFSLKMQQYGHDWIHGEMYEARIQRDPHWMVCGERAQGRVSATFQQSFVEASQQEESLRAEQIFTNGAPELSSQHRRSRSRVSSLIRAFNSEGLKDGTELDGQLKEGNGDTSWDKSALMSIKRELSEFSTSYQQQFNSNHFPSAGLFSPQDTNLYSAEVAAMAHMNSEPSFIGYSHSEHNISTQRNGNSNFFIHSELSPFKVWRGHNRFPFQQEVSGFIPCSEFPKWYGTPMYKDISLEVQPQGLCRFEQRDITHQGNNLASVVPSIPSQSTSMLQKALAVEKRCESELAGQYLHRKNTRSLGANRLPTQRPSTASPTIEMSRRVQDTISSVKALQQKIKMMTQQNIATGMTEKQQEPFYGKENVIPFGNNVKTVSPNIVNSNTNTTPFNISQLLTPLVRGPQGVEISEIQQNSVSPEPVEHPPVRAESRGATLDVRMSSYRSRASSLLFNLKDNRKRVKSTYSPTKFKGLETVEKNKLPSTQETRDIVIDIPDFEDSEIQFPHLEESSSINSASNQHLTQDHNTGLSLTTLKSQPATEHRGHFSEYTYQPFEMQSEMVHQSGFTSIKPENYTCHQDTNGQKLDYDLLPFPPAKQVMTANAETMRDKSLYTSSEIQRSNVPSDQTREYLKGQVKTEWHIKETAEREFTHMDKYQPLKKDYSNVSSQNGWEQTTSQDRENPPHPQIFERATMTKEEWKFPIGKYTGENHQTASTDFNDTESDKSICARTSHNDTELVNFNSSNQMELHAPFSTDTVEKPAYDGKQHHEAPKNKDLFQTYYGQNVENEKKDDYLIQNHNIDCGYRNQQIVNSNKFETIAQETGIRELNPTGCGSHIFQPVDAKLQFEYNTEKDTLSKPDNASSDSVLTPTKQRQFAEIKGQAMTEHIQPKHSQAELTGEYVVQGELSLERSARLILAGQTSPEKVEADKTPAELTEHKNVKQGKVDHVKDTRKEEQTDQSTEMQLDQCREENTQSLQTGVQKVTDEIINVTEEIAAEHMTEVQDEHVTVEDAEAERLKEEHIKIELTKSEQTGQAKITQTKTEETRPGFKPEQLEEERVGEEQVRIDDIVAQQTEEENSKTEIVRLEDISQQTTAEQGKVKVVEKDSVQEGQINEDHLETRMSNSKDKKAEVKRDELSMLKQTKEELAKPELTEYLQQSLAKPVVQITEEQQVRGETDNIEQVKTELAKTKAELAKIKEKMMSEQSDKVRNAFLPNEDEIKNEVQLTVNISKREEHYDKDQAAQKHQQSEDSILQDVFEVNRGADDYNLIREKYGFTDTTSTNRNILLAEGNLSLNDNETPVLPIDKIEVIKNNQSQEKILHPTKTLATPNIDNKERLDTSKPNEMTASQYVYSESSKEFKLSSTDRLLTDLDRANSNAPGEKVKDSFFEKMEKCEKLKFTNASQQRDSNLDKSLPPERKPKSTEQSLGQVHESVFTPTRPLSLKERSQTKQEILTSRIKAHAEKEISAIKERGFAIRDGFTSKTSTKQFTGSQSINIRQRPPSKEVSKKQESTLSSNATEKAQVEVPAVQTELAMSVSSPNPTTIPVKCAATSSDFTDHSQKQVPKEPIKSNENVANAKETVTHAMSTEKENQSEIKSLIKSKELVPRKEGKLKEMHCQMSGKQNEILKDNIVVSTNHLNKKKEDPPPSTSLVKAENSKPIVTENNVIKHEADYEDSASTINIGMCQAEASVADDSLHIMGIIVTERKPSVSSGQRNDCTQKHLNVQQKEPRNLELDKCHYSSGREESKVKEFSNEVIEVKTKAIVDYDAHPTVTKAQITIDTNSYSENIQETSTQEKRQNKVFEKLTTEETSPWKASSSYENVANVMTQKEKHHQELLDEKSTLSTVSRPVDVPADTQSVLCKHNTAQDTKEGKTENSGKSIKKDEEKNNTEKTNTPIREAILFNEPVTTEIVDTGLSHAKDSIRDHAETLLSHGTQPSMKDNTATVMNPSKNKTKDSESSLLLDDDRYDITPAEPGYKTNSANHLTGNEHRHVDDKHHYKETPLAENNQTDSDVHIGRIAITVVPAAIENDNMKVVGKLPPSNVPTVPTNVDAANNHKALHTLIHEEKVNTLNTPDRPKDLSLASDERQMKDGVEKKLGVQPVVSSVKKQPGSLKISKQHNIVNANKDNTQVKEGNPESADEHGKSEIQLMEEDYFQVQGVAETSKESRIDRDASDAVTKAAELAGIIPTKTAVSNESCNEGKHDFSMDHSKIKTGVSSSVIDEDTKRKNRKAGESYTSNNNSVPTERQTEKKETGQVICNSKQNTENQSAREKQSFRNPNRSRETLIKEKSEIKSKPKERVSTHPPEISAIADYARLKVIVSEDRENTIQEFPPNKKEGFFPLIQSRHSRRPVFTVDPQDLSVKEKSLPNKTAISSKVSKEPKPLAFPITEKEHQRTGMFKLGDKDRQEKVLVDAKTKDNSLDNGRKHQANIQGRHKLPTNHLKHQISEDAGKLADAQSLHLADHVHQSTNLPLQASSSSIVSRPRNAHTSQHLKSTENSNPLGNPEGFSSKVERKPCLDENISSQLTWTQEETKPTMVKKNERYKNTLGKTGDERLEKRQNRLASQQEDTTKQKRANELEKEQLPRMEEKRVEDVRIKHMIEDSRASLAEEERREAQREAERRATERKAIAMEIKKRRESQREAGRKDEEGKNVIQGRKEENAAKKEKLIGAMEEVRNINETDKRRIIEEETRVKLRMEEKHIKENVEIKLLKLVEEEMDSQEGQQKRAAQEDEQRRAAHQEQQRQTALIKEQRRKPAVTEEKQIKTTLQEKQRRAIQEEQQRRTMKEEQLSRTAQEEQQRRVVPNKQQMRVVQEKQQKEVLLERQHRRAVHDKEQSRAFQKEKQRSAVEEGEQKRAILEEQQKRAAQETQERRVFQEEQQNKVSLREQEIGASHKDWQRRTAEEQKGRASLIEEQQRGAARTEEERTAKQTEDKIQENKRKHREAETDGQNDKTVYPIQEQKMPDHQMQEQKIEKQKTEKWKRTQQEEEYREAVQNVETTVKPKDGIHLKEEGRRFLEESPTTSKVDNRVAKGQKQGVTNDNIRTEKREDKLEAYKDRATETEEEKKVAQMMDALQYYAITSTEPERKCREKQLSSPLPSQQRHNPSGLESPEDCHPRPHRPHAPASPASSLSRSNTSSPALGAKPSMFKVKDNTIRGSSFTKSVKPRFHKNFAEDFRVGSPMGLERAEEEQETMRHRATTPSHPDKVLNRPAPIKDSMTLPYPQNSSTALPHHRPYNRRSIALDEDDSRSVISNMSEDVESFATSVADPADVRSLYDYDRPESACSFSSDVSRSLGKPPLVPPKSEKALLKAKRLTTRRIKKELSKVVEDNRPQELSSNPSSSSTELQ